MGEWIKCSDRLPEAGIDVLAVTADGDREILSISYNPYIEKLEWNGGNWVWKLDLITHWQPLPEAP